MGKGSTFMLIFFTIWVLNKTLYNIIVKPKYLSCAKLAIICANSYGPNSILYEDNICRQGDIMEKNRFISINYVRKNLISEVN